MSESINPLLTKLQNGENLSEEEYKTIKTYLETETNQETIKQVLSNAKDYALRLIALKNINKDQDQEFLINLVLNDESPPVRQAALHLISTEDAFKKIVKETRDPIIMQNALLQIHDESFLAEYALHHNDFVIRRAALYNMSSPKFKDVYEQIALHDNTEAVQLMGIMKLDPDQSADTLLKIAVNEDESFYIRAAAVTRLKNPEKLMQVIIASKDKTIIKLALNEINDYKTLTKLRVLLPFQIQYLVSRRMKELLMI